VADALARHGISYRLESGGTVMVPARDMHEARLKLATEGLPKASGFGFELLEQDQGLGTSRLIEDARYHRAIEGELARSIATLNSVESARVHLALPRQSVFVRDRAKPSASVLLNLYAGRTLDENRVAGIVHLVASSVPELDAENVTVVDQRGRLLTSPAGGGADGSGGQQPSTGFHAPRGRELRSPHHGYPHAHHGQRRGARPGGGRSGFLANRAHHRGL
jgi:flagellar M-ring protein FliF